MIITNNIEISRPTSIVIVIESPVKIELLKEKEEKK
jgi:hypothetical protein